MYQFVLYLLKVSTNTFFKQKQFSTLTKNFLDSFHNKFSDEYKEKILLHAIGNTFGYSKDWEDGRAKRGKKRSLESVEDSTESGK